MALGIRKSIKIAPGVRINISKSGVSTSLGVKGATVNLSKRGTRVTTGIPGTGISSSKFYGVGKREVTPTPPTPAWAHVATLLIIAAVLWWIFS